MKSVMRTLVQCHAKGILHRDVKPSNFLLLNDDPSSPLKAIGASLGCLKSCRRPPCDLRHATCVTCGFCDLWLVICGLQPVACDLWPATCGLRAATSELQSTNIGLSSALSKVYRTLPCLHSATHRCICVLDSCYRMVALAVRFWVLLSLGDLVCCFGAASWDLSVCKAHHCIYTADTAAFM